MTKHARASEPLQAVNPGPILPIDKLAVVPPAERKRIAQTCELAWGRVFY